MSRPVTTVGPATRGRGEDGVGVLGLNLGVLAFLTLVLGATQVCLDLYATSAVTAAAYDAARIAAGSDGDVEGAEAHARAVLGRFGDEVSFDWRVTEDRVTVRVQARNPPILLPVVSRAVGFGEIDRTVTVRREALR